MVFYNFFADREAKPGAGDFVPRVQPAEWLENFIDKLRLYAHSVIADGKMPIVVVAFTADVYLRRPSDGLVFDGIANQVLNEPHNLNRIAV